MGHGLDNNRQVLAQWSELFPQLPLPSDWQKFQDSNLAQAMAVQEQAPWLADLLSGNASASLKLAAIDGKLPSREDYQQHLRQQAQTQEADYQRQLAALDQEFEAKARQRLGDRRFEAERQAEVQRQQQLQRQRQETAEFEKNLAQRAFR